MRTVFSADSGIYRLLRCGAQRQNHGKTAAFRSRLVPKFTTKAAHNRSGNVESETARLGTRLELPEKIVWRSDTNSCVFESNCDGAVFLAGGNPKLLLSCGGHGAPTVRGQVQENLNEPVPVGP